MEEVWDEAHRLSRKEGLRRKGLMFIPAFELLGNAQLTWGKEHGPVDIDFSEGACNWLLIRFSPDFEVESSKRAVVTLTMG